MKRSKEEILKDAEKLIDMHKNGELGGEIMPEDVHPLLDPLSNENYLYFTLPMALNYRRDSYRLWECAKATYDDESTAWIYNPSEVIKRDFSEVQAALTKYKVALFKQRQTEIWIKLCESICNLLDGDLRNLFDMHNNDVVKIRNYMQKEKKGSFPYLSGIKICNYWLHVIYMYCQREYINPEAISVAPDTHVIKASLKLGIINPKEAENVNVQEIVADAWFKLFKGTKYKPIDIHTVLWLWSRNGFKEIN